nr:hypothetical protein [Tanacetum cinerariifolium]
VAVRVSAPRFPCLLFIDGITICSRSKCVIPERELRGYQ